MATPAKGRSFCTTCGLEFPNFQLNKTLDPTSGKFTLSCKNCQLEIFEQELLDDIGELFYSRFSLELTEDVEELMYKFNDFVSEISKLKFP